MGGTTTTERAGILGMWNASRLDPPQGWGHGAGMGMDWASHRAEVGGRALLGGHALRTLLSVQGLPVNHKNSINPTARMETPHPTRAKEPNRWRESRKSLQTFLTAASPSLAKLLEASEAPRGTFPPWICQSRIPRLCPEPHG